MQGDVGQRVGQQVGRWRVHGFEERHGLLGVEQVLAWPRMGWCRQGGVAAGQQQRVVSRFGHRLSAPPGDGGVPLFPGRDRGRQQQSGHPPRSRSRRVEAGTENRPRPGGLAQQKQILRGVHGASQQGIQVVDGCSAHGQFGELGRGVDAAAPARIPGRGVEGVGDRGQARGRAQRGMAGVLFGITDHCGESLMQPAPRRRDEVRVGDRRDQRVGEVDALTVELDKSGPNDLGEGQRTNLVVRGGRRDGRDRRSGQCTGGQEQLAGRFGQPAQPVGDQRSADRAERAAVRPPPAPALAAAGLAPSPGRSSGCRRWPGAAGSTSDGTTAARPARRRCAEERRRSADRRPSARPAAPGRRPRPGRRAGRPCGGRRATGSAHPPGA